MSERSQKASRFLAWSVFLVGLVLVSPFVGAHLPYSLMFDAHGDLRTDGIFRTLAPILFDIERTWHSTLEYFAGLPLFFIGLAGLVSIYARSAKFEIMRSRPRITVALAIAGLAHLAILAASIPLFFVSAGEWIRPMGWAVFVCVVAFVALCLVVPFSVIAIAKEKARWLGLLALIGGMTPFFFGQLLLQIAMKVTGFNLED